MSTEKKIPDYADIQRLENIAWSSRSYELYAKEYHRLATEFGEELLIELIEQYYSGPAW